ncbi:MAG: sulfite exporter TauE/SafE family protein [Pseudomonadota bacterium]
MEFIDLWNPTHPGVAAALITALLLGLIHGMVPDEHTWPITFSYAVGSYSTRKGLRAGLLFSLTFTVQRAIASELAWLGLSQWMQIGWLNQALFVPIGLLMAGGGWLMLRQRRAMHLHLIGECHEARLDDSAESTHWTRMTGWMPALHGFVAGWGFGAFALILYTTLAPAMPSAAWGWVPGALFGLGTLIVQAVAGALFGKMAASRKLSPQAIRAVALTTAARTLLWGGAAYTAAGVFGLSFPKLADWSINTGLHVHGLSHIDLPLVLAVVCVAGVGLGTFFTQTRALRSTPPTSIKRSSDPA